MFSPAAAAAVASPALGLVVAAAPANLGVVNAVFSYR